MFTSQDAQIPRDGPPSRRRRLIAARGEDEARPSIGSAIDPVLIVKSVWNSKLLIVCCAVAGLGIAAVVAVTSPKKFVATAQILIDPRDLKVVANEVTPNGLPSESTLALIESQASVLTSSSVLLRVANEADLQHDPDFNGLRKSALASLLPGLFGTPDSDAMRDPKKIERLTVATMRERLSVERETKSFVLSLSMQSEDPEKAARLANLIAASFIEEQGLVQSDTAKRATTALSSRLEELRRSVTEAEHNVEDYKSRNALIGVNGRLVDDQYLVQINDQLAKARGDITALRVKAQSMQAASVDDVVRGGLPEEANAQGLARLRQSYAELAQQAAMLATKLGPRHPQRIAAEGALSQARDAIRGELSRIVAAAQTELARATQTEKNLTAQINELKNKQVTTSGSFVRLRELEREVDASRAVYEAFLLRARETSEQESLNTANIRVISEAVPPLKPAGLSRKIAILMGGLLGAMGGMGLAAAFAVIRQLRPLFAAPPAAEPFEHKVRSEPISSLSPTGMGIEEAIPTSQRAFDAERLAEQQRPAAPSEPTAYACAPSTEKSAAASVAPETTPVAVASADAAGEPLSWKEQPSKGARPIGIPARVENFDAVARRPSIATAARDTARRQSLAGAARPDGGDRATLRDRIRAMSGELMETPASSHRQTETEHHDASSLADEILSVRKAIADLRVRRESPLVGP